MHLSVLDLSPIPAGLGPSDAIRHSIDLAQQAEAAGYFRYWLAEHHNTAALACSSPELLICRIAAQTSHIRVGSGGVMLPNHSALKVAESFRVLEAMFPTRIDLGLGRAPGTDPVTASALRRGPNDAHDFPQQLSDLVGYLKDVMPADHPHSRVRATPVGVPSPAVWILGSSTYGAEVAAVNGFGFAFAHHIVPESVHAAMERYHRLFRASPFGQSPKAILAVNAITADTDEAAWALASTAELYMMRTRTGRTRLPIPSVEEALAYEYSPEEAAVRHYNRSRIHVGTPDRVAERIRGLANEVGATEVMVNSMIHDHGQRVASYQGLAQAWR
ncbi:MAG: LLM class flavin-dependent oxidoreductase [Pigmentiphaga sp.]